MTRSPLPLEVPLLPHKSVAIDFDGGDLSSDAGLIPLSLADQARQLTHRLADAVADPRAPQRIDTFVTGTDPVGHGLVANWVLADGRPQPAHRVGPASPTLFDVCAGAGRRSAAVLGDHRLVGVMGATRAEHHWPPQGRIPAGARRDRYGYAALDAHAPSDPQSDPNADRDVHGNGLGRARHGHHNSQQGVRVATNRDSGRHDQSAEGANSLSGEQRGRGARRRRR